MSSFNCHKLALAKLYKRVSNRRDNFKVRQLERRKRSVSQMNCTVKFWVIALNTSAGFRMKGPINLLSCSRPNNRAKYWGGHDSYQRFRSFEFRRKKSTV